MHFNDNIIYVLKTNSYFEWFTGSNGYDNYDIKTLFRLLPNILIGYIILNEIYV